MGIKDKCRWEVKFSQDYKRVEGDFFLIYVEFTESKVKERLKKGSKIFHPPIIGKPFLLRLAHRALQRCANIYTAWTGYRGIGSFFPTSME